MKKDIDIEELLRRQQCGPHPRVKQSVLSRFIEMRSAGRRSAGWMLFWKRPVPLYLAAASVIIAIGLSFLLGRGTSRLEEHGMPAQVRVQAIDTVTFQEPEWAVTQSDVF
ncbi:MAG: hypothetical protein JSV33_08635 [bacterium]|nr:MAG: hypothetical protein JSV33_08635 [bacterium]